MKTSAKLEQECGRHVTSEEIAEEIGVEEDQIRDTVAVGCHSVSLDAPRDEEDERCLLDMLADEHPSPEEEAMGRVLERDVEAVVSSLDVREREVLRLYFGLGERESLTLEEIGRRYGLTRERIRQIRNGALAKLSRRARRRRLESYLEG